MPRNKIGGNKSKRGANKNDEVKSTTDFKKETYEIYGRVDKKLGSGRFMVMCTDRMKRNCRIVGRLYKRAWINTRTIVLVSLHTELGGNYNKGSIIVVYNDVDVRRLVQYGEISKKFSIGEEEEYTASHFEEDEFDFDAI